MSLNIAITGNIGSGKSTACGFFRALNIPVFDADTAAKNLYQEQAVREKMTTRFGRKIYDSEGKIHTKALAAILFSQPEALDFVEKLIHPLVRQHFRLWRQEQHQAPYTLYEAAILFEKGLENEFDKVIYVAAPESLRLQRLLKRDQSHEAAIRQRMQLQWKDEIKIPLSDYVLHNIELEELKQQILQLHSLLISSSFS
ncbi:MAG: dephospho-CoA kinase [Bacteroidales bacterium]|nr:dephospho-CoA kinase [Bacteroidales bacterium]